MKSESFRILLQMDKLRHWNINGSILNLAWVIGGVQIQLHVFEETAAFKKGLSTWIYSSGTDESS